MRIVTLAPHLADWLSESPVTERLAAFADARLGAPPTGRLLDDVAMRSGGNAFYALELLDALPVAGLGEGLDDVVLERLRQARRGGDKA